MASAQYPNDLRREAQRALMAEELARAWGTDKNRVLQDLNQMPDYLLYESYATWARQHNLKQVRYWG